MLVPNPELPFPDPLEWQSNRLFIQTPSDLHFRMVTALLPVGGRRRGGLKGLVQWLLLPLAESIRTVMHHILVVSVHLWLLRFAVICAGVLFVVLPSTLVLWRAIPNPLDSILNMPQALQIAYVLASAATSLVGAVVFAFCAIYDARLYMRLSAKVLTHM
jgi:hypothetical protein